MTEISRTTAMTPITGRLRRSQIHHEASRRPDRPVPERTAMTFVMVRAAGLGGRAIRL
jgi:hypothetical protein